MKRTLYNELLAWKNHPGRLPLIVRGARQVGKSYLVEEFGQAEFDVLHKINFEKQSHLASCFASLDPKEILKELELRANIQVSAGTTLLFLDEIQDCPDALKSLRYFAEEMPELHVIAAGSLLEFVLEDKDFSFPVGRVQVMNLGPLTFKEYLAARQQTALVDLLETARDPNDISSGVHIRLLEFVREFFFVGGMPGVVSLFLDSESYLEALRRQATILELYALDFGKYGTKHAEYRHIKKMFDRAPTLVGKPFKFSKIDPDCANPARDYREALTRLKQARLLVPVHLTKANGLPLRAEKSEKRFRIFFLDIGLLRAGLGWQAKSMDATNTSTFFQGVIAEQFVSQELSSLQDPFIDRDLYYWENTSPGSSAEIDFLVNLNQQMLPVEVKSGTSGRLKSLKQFMQAKNCPLGLRISENSLSLEGDILSIPFYMIEEIPRLIEEI